MRYFFIICFFFILSLDVLASSNNFKMVGQFGRLSMYESADKSIRIVKRRQRFALQNLNWSKDALKEMAETRLKALEVVLPGTQDFKLLWVYKAPVFLQPGVKAYVWNGSYKYGKGRVQYVQEFISEGYTWNVYVDKKSDLKNGERAIKEVLAF